MAEGGGKGDNGGLVGLVREVERLGFDRYLLDTAVVDQAARDLTEYLARETRLPVPGSLVRLGLRLLAGAVHARIQKGVHRALGGTLGRFVTAFERLPGCGRFLDAARVWLAGKANDEAAKAQLAGCGNKATTGLISVLVTVE
jgi:hypothetical protein